jgi:hypothetical protein
LVYRWSTDLFKSDTAWPGVSTIKEKCEATVGLTLPVEARPVQVHVRIDEGIGLKKKASREMDMRFVPNELWSPWNLHLHPTRQQKAQFFGTRTKKRWRPITFIRGPITFIFGGSRRWRLCVQNMTQFYLHLLTTLHVWISSLLPGINTSYNHKVLYCYSLSKHHVWQRLASHWWSTKLPISWKETKLSHFAWLDQKRSRSTKRSSRSTIINIRYFSCKPPWNYLYY